MVPQAQLRNKIYFLLAVILGSCSHRPDAAYKIVSREQVQIRKVNGSMLVNDTLFTGTLFTLHSNGIDTIEFACYENGKQHGLAFERYLNHQLQTKRYFDRGQKVGKLVSFWEDGTKQLEYNFKNGEYDGNGKEWAPNGTLIKNLNYSNGQEHGLQQLWTLEGTLWANYEVRDGRHYGITGVKSCSTIWKNDSVTAH
jgi:antitoxin component YwqK of YwqJK toxin-antitoxin module